MPPPYYKLSYRGEIIALAGYKKNDFFRISLSCFHICMQSLLIKQFFTYTRLPHAIGSSVRAPINKRKKGTVLALVRIDFSTGLPGTFAQPIASAVDHCMQELLNVPAGENYVVCQRHDPVMLRHDPENVSAGRLACIVFIQITLNQGRAPELKSRFFAELTGRICAAAGLRPQDVFINLVEVARDNWSFGQHTG